MTDKSKNKVSNRELRIKKDSEKIKDLETELEEIKSKFEEAESIAQFGFWELDPKTLNRKWTNGLFRIVGFDPGFDHSNHYNDNKKVIHPEDWDYFYDTTQTVFNTGKDTQMDVRVIRIDGSIRIFRIIAKPKHDDNGNIITVRGTAQDITDLKSMENRLKKSEAFYRTLFENTGAASIIIAEDTTILMANAQFEKLSGYSKEEINGKKSWKDLVLKEDLEMFEKYHSIRRKNIESAPESYEARLIDEQGITKNVLINVAMIPETKRSIASLTDLTKIKIAEKMLQKTLTRFYSILSNMRASVLLVTEENMIEFANQAFCDYFDILESPEELIGLKGSQIIEKIKNAYAFPQEELSRIKEIVSQWDPIIGEEIHMRSERACIRDFIPILIEGQRYGRLWLHLDITDRKKIEKELAYSERRYRYIVEKATAGMFILDKNGIIKYLNGHMAQILNYSKNEMLEMHIKKFIDEKEEFYRIRKPSENQIEKYNWFKLIDSEGNIFWSNLTVSPIFNSKKNYTGLLRIITDINMQKGVEEAFLEREEVFTDIIYDMMEMLNNIANDKTKSEFNKEWYKNTSNN